MGAAKLSGPPVVYHNLKGAANMNLWTAILELAATLADAWACADVPGHLRAWWELVRSPELLEG